eukprot:135033-Alexandrium_andersonii.AAC.1
MGSRVGGVSASECSRIAVAHRVQETPFPALPPRRALAERQRVRLPRCLASWCIVNRRRGAFQPRRGPNRNALL